MRQLWIFLVLKVDFSWKRKEKKGASFIYADSDKLRVPRKVLVSAGWSLRSWPVRTSQEQFHLKYIGTRTIGQDIPKSTREEEGYDGWVNNRRARLGQGRPMSAIEPSYLGGSGGMPPRQILKTGTSKNAIIASKTLKCDRKVNQNLRVQIVRIFFLPRNLCRNFFSWPSALHEFFFRCDSSAGNFFFNSSNPPSKIKWSIPKPTSKGYVLGV